MKRILLFSFLLMFCLVDQVWAQGKTVTGTITSSDGGEGLPGVNVIALGTTTGTTTDVEGNYRINLPESATRLQYSFIGYITQEISIGNKNVIDVRLVSDIKQLSEVVVTGYGTELKREVTGSIASINGDVIQDIPSQSFDRAIQGRASGVQISAASGQPGGALNIRVRGYGSINAGNDPLIIVDGVQMANLGQTSQGSGNPLAAINPNDIADIQVLKDAASSAIYGAQAANGVILVTTKSGSNKGATTVTLSMQEGVVQPMNLYDVMDANEYATIRSEAYRNAGLDVNDAYTLYGNPNAGDLPSYDWVDAMFRDARLRTYDVAASGGDAKTSFYMGVSYNYQEGQVIMSDWERLTGRLNLSHKVSDKLSFDAKLSLSHNTTIGSIANGNFVNGPFIGSFSAIPTSPAINPETGEYNPYPTNGQSHLFGYNILQGVNEEVRSGRTLQTVSSLGARYEIIPGLALSGLVGVDFSMNRDDNQRPSSIPAFRAAGGSAFVNNRRSVNINSNVNLGYSKVFNDVHSVSALVGFEYKTEQREGASATGQGFADPYFRLLSDAARPFAVGGFFQDYKRNGVFGTVKYDYNDKYLASATLRRDGHSRFGEKNRYGTFYAGSVGWRISSESFMENLTFISDLKLRASYGVLGNSDIPNYDALTQYGSGLQGQYIGEPKLTLTRLGNDLLTWEEESQVNIGLDYALFANRVYGSIDVWRTNNNELLLSTQLPQDAGYINTTNTPNEATILQNVGKVRNEGIDFELTTVNIDKGSFQWRSRFNISFLRNELLELDNGRDRINGASGIPEYIVGEDLAFFYLLDYAGVNPANGRAMVYDIDGNPTYRATLDDAGVKGSAIPDYFGGLSNTFSFKGLSLEVFFQYQIGNEAFNGDLYNLAESGSSVDNQLRSQLDRWQAPGDVTNVPKPFQGGTIEGVDQHYGFVGTTRFLSDASYIRLKQVTLGYDFSQTLLSRIGLKKLGVFVQGLNMLTFTKFDGIDPEVVANNNTADVSSFGVYPLGRQFTAGINIGL